jgi:hypothetical protein
MKKLTISLVLAVVLVSGAAIAANATEKSDSNSGAQAAGQSAHSCGIQESGHACGAACAASTLSTDSADALLSELVQAKIQADRYSALQAEVDVLLEIIDFD